MKLLQNAGTFDILTPINQLSNQLKMIEKAGRTCYQSENKEITQKTAERFVKMIMRRGHYSVIEHSQLIIRFNNLSRGFTHEQVRHRLTGISQESTRYVDYAGEGKGVDLDRFQLHFIMPPHKDPLDPVMVGEVGGFDFGLLEPQYMVEIIEGFYRALRRAEWVPEDARQFLPIGTRSQIVISANLREWRHIFHMRTSKAAHWEIRGVMCDLLERIQRLIPVIFDDFQEALDSDKNNQRYFEQTEQAWS